MEDAIHIFATLRIRALLWKLLSKCGGVWARMWLGVGWGVVGCGLGVVWWGVVGLGSTVDLLQKLLFSWLLGHFAIFFSGYFSIAISLRSGK